MSEVDTKYANLQNTVNSNKPVASRGAANVVACVDAIKNDETVVAGHQVKVFGITYTAGQAVVFPANYDPMKLGVLFEQGAFTTQARQAYNVAADALRDAFRSDVEPLHARLMQTRRKHTEALARVNELTQALANAQNDYEVIGQNVTEQEAALDAALDAVDTSYFS